MNFAKLGVPKDQLVEVMKLQEGGIHQITVKNKGSNDLMVAFYDEINSRFKTNQLDTKVSSEAVQDGDTLANLPVVPGTFVATSTGCPTLVDSDKDGVLKANRVVGSQLVIGADGVTSAAATRTLTSAGGGFDGVVYVGDKVVVSSGLDKGVYTVTAVNSDTVVVIDRNWPTGGQTTADFAAYAAEIVMGSLNYFTGYLDLSYPTGDAPDGKGTVVGTEMFPLNLAPGDQLSVDIDAGGAVNATFDAAAATAAGSGGSFAAMASETMEVRFATGAVFDDWQTITFGTEGTQQAAVDLINAQMVGGYAVINGANVDIISDSKGTGATVQTQNVAAGVTSKLGIQDSVDQDGTGDVSNIDAVTFAEAKTVIEADVSDSLVLLDETGGIRISSDSAEVGADSKVQCGGVYAKFGVDNALHLGSDADAKMAIAAAYTKTVTVAAGEWRVYEVPVATSGLIKVMAIAKDGPTLLEADAATMNL